MRDTNTVIVLSAVAISLGIGACIKINPLTTIGLVPIFTAISLIIKSICGGRSTAEPTDPRGSHDRLKRDSRVKPLAPPVICMSALNRGGFTRSEIVSET